ncbi:MAG: hypothetical protein IJ661_10030 [Lachnospiraceae bacterium]|nr:hypothetical protein [Lachnospiraceae bacterium]
MSELMSELMSKLERRMELVYEKFGYNSSFNSEGVADLLDVQLKTAGRLLAKAEKIGVLESEGSTKKK